MKKYLLKSLILIMVVLLGAALFAGCAPQDQGEQDQGGEEEPAEVKGTIKLAYVNWAEGVAMTNLAQAILEDKMGYEVETTMADVAPIFTSLASGDYDAFLDAWLPVTHESYMEEYGEDLNDLGYNFEGARIGLVVPTYMDINSIEELNSIKDDLEGQIIGIDSGAGIMKATADAIEKYGLELELIPGSGPTMTAALKKAIDNNDPVVVTGWAPHWKFARWDLKFLEDPQGVYGDVENIHTVTRKGLGEDMPDVEQFLTNFYMDGQQLGDLMGAIADSEEDPIVVAREWMNAHEDLVNSWLPQE